MRVLSFQRVGGDPAGTEGEVDRRVDGLDQSALPNEAVHHRPGSVLELADAKWSRAAYSYEVNEARRQMTPLDTAG